MTTQNSAYKQSILLVMYSGRIVKWTGFAYDSNDAARRAKTYAKTKYNDNIWDICNRPVST